MGSCMPTNMCATDWELDKGDGRCVYRLADSKCNEQNNRIYRYDKSQVCVAAECKDGWSLHGGQCTFDKADQHCDIKEAQIYTWNSSGLCVPSSKCSEPTATFQNGKCYVQRVGCPDGFTKVGDECYRLFSLGGEGRSTASFTVNLTDQVRARYNFQKDRRYRDGDFDVSSNFGLSGSRSGVRDSSSVSSGWVSGLTVCSLNSRQNDGNATLEVWVK